MEKIRILVAEDEPLILRTISDRLTEEGHEVFRAENGRVALRLLEQHPVDVVLTDVVMPEVDGIEVILHLRKAYPGTRVVCMSAHDAVYLDIMHQLGAVRVLVKPFDWRELHEAVQGVMADEAGVRTGREICRQRAIEA